MPSENRVYVVEQTVVTRFNQTLEDVAETEEADEGQSESGEENESQGSDES